MDGGNSTAATLTTFYIFEGSADMVTWKYVGQQTARDRQQALAKQFPKDEREALTKAPRVAVSLNAWRPEEIGGPRPMMPPFTPATTPAAGPQDELS